MYDMIELLYFAYRDFVSDPDAILDKRISVADALTAVDECGAPVVVMAGGEPLLHKELPKIVQGVIARKKFAIVCTNALLMGAQQPCEFRFGEESCARHLLLAAERGWPAAIVSRTASRSVTWRTTPATR